MFIVRQVSDMSFGHPKGFSDILWRLALQESHDDRR